MDTSREKKIKKITRRMQTKLVLLFLIIVLALVGLCVRLTYINMTNGAQYSKQILSQQKYETKTIPYQRGDIVDRNGIVLATSIKVYNLILDPKIMRCNEAKTNDNQDDVCHFFRKESGQQFVDKQRKHK